MGLTGKFITHLGAFALGFCLCYSSCANKDYTVYSANGHVYVEDKNTGQKALVEDFETKPKNARKKLSSEEIGHDLKRRVEDAYRSLTR